MTPVSPFLKLFIISFVCIRAAPDEFHPCGNTSSKLHIHTCVECRTTDMASSLIEGLYSKIQEEECKLANPADYPVEFFPSCNEVFDFIVVGAGSAGCVVSNRLTENPTWTVLLLEAGKNPTKTTEVPGLAPTLLGSDLDWRFQTEPAVENCRGMTDGRCNLPSGKVLGGSSAISLLQYVRGSRQFYDSWAKSGLDGWDYESCLYYFKKSEDMNAKDIVMLPDSARYHSEKGPLSVDNMVNTDEETIIGAMKCGVKETGYKLISDFNGKHITGFGEVQATVINGKRCSAAKAFLSHIKNRSNLKVMRNVFATKVLINSSNKAYGVRVLDSKGEVLEFFAKKEVIVSAGPINSAKLLMLSGIGPRHHLEAMGIDCLKDLPVGENFVDHPTHLGISLSYKHVRKPESPTGTLFEFLTSKNSILSGLGLSNMAFLINTTDTSSENPDIIMLPVDWDRGNKANLRLLLKALNINDEISQQYYNQEKGRTYFLLLIAIVDAKSRGTISLRSKDPLSPPYICPGYLKKSEDIDTILRGIDYVYKLAASKCMKSIDAQVQEIVPPSCQQYSSGSRERRICSMRHMISTCFSYGGTCKMGSETDSSSVVDSKLRVLGIDCLRVIDSSVILRMPTGSAQALSYMIGEKGADMVKETHCN